MVQATAPEVRGVISERNTRPGLALLPGSRVGEPAIDIRKQEGTDRGVFSGFMYHTDIGVVVD